MWEDLSPYLSGSGPTSTVLDANGNATILLSAAAGGSVVVDWTFSGSAIALLGDIEFTANLYADPLGPGGPIVLGPVAVAPPAAPITSPVNYSATILIPGGTLQADDVYEFTVVVTAAENSDAAAQLPIAGFVESPLVAVGP